MWWSRKNKKEEQRVKDAAQIQKVQESQRVLLEAATSTADAAQEVTMRLKNRLDDSVRQLESTAKLIADALIICNSDGIIDSANPAAEQSFGWKASDLKGQSISQLFRKNGLNAEPSEILDVFLEDNIIGSDKFEQPIEQLKGRRKTGELFWIDGSITQMERLDGNIIIMMLVRDVTTRMEVQRELKMNEARYRSIFEQSFDGIMIVQNYHVVAANPAISRVLGYSAESFIAKPMVNFFHKQSSKVLIDNHTFVWRVT